MDAGKKLLLLPLLPLLLLPPLPLLRLFFAFAALIQWHTAVL
jgi:hypothetical protein